MRFVARLNSILLVTLRITTRYLDKNWISTGKEKLYKLGKLQSLLTVNYSSVSHSFKSCAKVFCFMSRLYQSRWVGFECGCVRLILTAVKEIIILSPLDNQHQI